ncbi:MAG: hypothetical protein AB7I79_03255 [Rhizobiaceae bacterium]
MNVVNRLPGTVEPYERHPEDVQIWAEQQVWGHRFMNDQTPWYLLLEALGIMAHRAADRNVDQVFPGPSGGRDARFSYDMNLNHALRTVLFVDRHIDEIASSDLYITDASKWARWFEMMGKGGEGERRFGYLRERFTKFAAFRNAVDLLRSAEVESSAKRPTSRHLAPRGPALLSADFGEKKGNKVNKDRRFFSRGGELFYLMLNRSAQARSLEEPVRNRLLSDGSRWNALAKVFDPPVEEEKVSFDGLGYLPLDSHRAYDLAGADWLALLSLGGLPDDNLPEPLMRLSGLAVVRYVIERAAAVAGRDAPPIPLDMVSSSTVAVQKISKDCYRQHRDMTRTAIEKLVLDSAADPAWLASLGDANRVRSAKQYMAARFSVDPDEFGQMDPVEYPAHLAREAIDNHDQHLGRVLGVYSERVGMAVARRGSGRWYAAADGLLEALVLSNVTVPVELETFLDLLWERYRFVVGTDVARKAFGSANYAQFKANQRLLEDRLRILGLLNRLSDDCAFVRNPFYQGGSA